MLKNNALVPLVAHHLLDQLRRQKLHVVHQPLSAVLHLVKPGVSVPQELPQQEIVVGPVQQSIVVQIQALLN